VERAELLALVDAAPGDLPGLRGRVREWRAPDFYSVRRPGEVRTLLIGAMLVGPGPGGPLDPSARSERWWDVWFGAPDRWRVEGDHDSLRLCDGTQRWEGFRTFVTERGAPSLAGAGVLGPLLAPAALLGEFQLRPVAEGEIAGRPTVEAVAVRRTADVALRWVATDTLSGAIAAEGGTHRIEFDAATGIVLTHRVYDGAEAMIGVELVDPEVGEQDPAIFALPDGIAVQTAAEEAAARAPYLGSVGAGSRGRPLEDLVGQVVPWGPPPEDPEAAEAAVTAAFRDYSDTDESGHHLVNVHVGTGLGDAGAEVGRRYPGNARMVVEALKFVSPDEAAVWYTVEIDGRVVSPVVVRRPGRAVCVGGRWFVERQTVVDLMALAGVHPPPPPPT
jgi:hypothetical protein